MILVILVILLHMLGWITCLYWRNYGDGKQYICFPFWVGGTLIIFIAGLEKVGIING